MPGWSLFRTRKRLPQADVQSISTLVTLPQGIESLAAAVKRNDAAEQAKRAERAQRGRLPSQPLALPVGQENVPEIPTIAASAVPPEVLAGANTYPPPTNRHRRASSIHSHRSVRSLRSARSSRSGRSQRNPSGTRTRLAPNSLPRTGPDMARRCYVCARRFTGFECTTCNTSYSNDCALAEIDSLANPLDFDLLFDVASANDYELVEAVVSRAFADVSIIVASFCKEDPENPAVLNVNREAVSLFYNVLGSLSSTSPMRAVLQGAQQALYTRPHSPLSKYELAYILILLECPVFTECSMFTKIMGPLQKLGRYSSLRSRARMLLEQSMGLVGNCTNETHRKSFISFLAGTERTIFESRVDLLNSYIGYRLMFHFHYKIDNATPQLDRRHLRRDLIMVDWYAEDWRIMAFVKTLEMYFIANEQCDILPASSFTNLVIDHVDLESDFDYWQNSLRRQQRQTKGEDYLPDLAMPNKLYFCQFPFLISMMSKSTIFKHSSKRQLVTTSYRAVSADEVARIARIAATSRGGGATPMFTSHRSTLNIHIRRTHLLEDSLMLLRLPDRELRKVLRVEFENEQGVDAGGLRKEWMLLLFRQLFDPSLGVFVLEEGSYSSWFGKQEMSYYELAGLALGLALQNSVTVDVTFSALVFKKLMDRPHTIEDAREVWPSIVGSLDAILSYEGNDFDQTFSLDFIAPDGTPLIDGGENIPVTMELRSRYVALVVSHLTKTTDQFRAFQKGFQRVTEGNALTLFRPDEIELLLRGDRKPLDVTTLRQVAKYLHWHSKKVDTEPVVNWFWEFFDRLEPEKQAQLLSFITATDRVPATGITNLNLRIACLGPDSNRLPVAHTCFNQLGLYRYATREKLENKLYMAMTECQGFGIK